MSLDVYLVSAHPQQRQGTGIFIREITCEEWDEKFPGREPIMLPRDNFETGEPVEETQP